MLKALTERRGYCDLCYGGFLAILGCKDRTKMDSLIGLSLCSALDISWQTIFVTELEPLIKWQAVNQHHISLKTYYSGQGSSAQLSTCGG